MSEDIFSDRKAAGWSLDLVHAPLPMLRELDGRAIWVYTNCVRLYTSRVLTHENDILAAFDGICNLLETKMEAPFVFGLPTSHFDFALLWQPGKPATRRLKAKEDGEKSDAYGQIEFPTWSWCGWKDATMAYDSDMLEGCWTNLHEWLMEHTWIYWHIRDGHGRLRPLWDGKRSKGLRIGENRWRGYASQEVNGQDSHHVVLGEGKESDYFDSYGRWYRSDLPVDHEKGFNLTLPDYPYRVVMAEHNSGPDREFPDQPILQFWTWHASLYVVKEEAPRLGTENRESRQFDIFDELGDWCGSIVIDDTSLIEERMGNEKHAELEFIAISEAKGFTKKECETWTYYTAVERDQSEWDLYYVLLVVREPRGLKWRRVALGKVFKAAFSNADWKEIILG